MQAKADLTWNHWSLNFKVLHLHINYRHCLSGFSRETETIGDCTYACIHIDKDIYYKKLAHIFMEAEKSTICCLQARDPGGPIV